MKKIKSALIVVLLLVIFLITNMQKTFPKVFYKKVNMIISETNSIREDLKDRTTDIKGFPVQTYWDFYALPFKELNFIDEDVYEELKQTYSLIDFTSEFEKGDVSSYDFYIEKYQQLVNNEISFYDADTDEEYYLNQYGQLKNREHSQYDPDKYTYFFFDIDGDSYPELGVTEYIVAKTKRFIYVFKYDMENDRMIKWYYTESVYSQIMGTRKMGGDNSGRYYYFDQLDINGEIEIATEFVIDTVFTNGEVVYLVTLPWDREEEGPLLVTETMKSQGYYTEGEKWFYFRVTEEQFEELTERFFLAKEEAEKNLEKVSYTYDELFGDD